MIEVLALPLAVCLVLTAIHVYLGFHVLARGVIFVDLALAQVAALGLTVAVLAGHPPGSDGAYAYALAFALGAAVLFAASRRREPGVPQEAIIGIVYVVSAALAVMVVDRAPQGAEQIKQLLVGSLLAVSPQDLLALTLLYGAIGIAHFFARRSLLAISLDPQAAGPRVLAWDLFFYVTFAAVVTSSVRIAGVLLVFSYLVIPAAIGALLARGTRARLAIGWISGGVMSFAGLAASWAWDLPTGAAIVGAFGGAIAVVAAALGVRRLSLRATAVGVGAAVALAGALLAAAPRMDHLWVDALERFVPVVQEAFLTAPELEARADAVESIARADEELSRLAVVQEQVRWGARAMDEEKQERMRQYIAGRSEIAAGDRLALRELAQKARERQRFIVGMPMLALGAALAVWGLAPRVSFRDRFRRSAWRAW